MQLELKRPTTLRGLKTKLRRYEKIRGTVHGHKSDGESHSMLKGINEKIEQMKKRLARWGGKGTSG